MRLAAFLAGAAGAAFLAALRLAGLRLAAFLAGAAFLAAFFFAGLRLAAFFAGAAFFAAAFFAGLRLAAFFGAAFLAAALRAVVFLAATGPPRGKTLGLPEGSLNQECQT